MYKKKTLCNLINCYIIFQFYSIVELQIVYRNNIVFQILKNVLVIQRTVLLLLLSIITFCYSGKGNVQKVASRFIYKKIVQNSILVNVFDL